MDGTVKCPNGRDKPSHTQPSFRRAGSLSQNRNTQFGFSNRQQVKDTPPLPRKNYFDVLAVEEIEKDSSATTDMSPVPETARTEKPQKSKIEKRLPKRLNIGTAEVGPNSLYLRVEIESTDNQRKYGVRALVDSGATGLFIDREYVKSNQIPTMKLPQPIPVFNVDGTANTDLFRK
jgi:hypothetical protein